MKSARCWACLAGSCCVQLMTSACRFASEARRPGHGPSEIELIQALYADSMVSGVLTRHGMPGCRYPGRSGGDSRTAEADCGTGHGVVFRLRARSAPHRAAHRSARRDRERPAARERGTLRGLAGGPHSCAAGGEKARRRCARRGGLLRWRARPPLVPATRPHAAGRRAAGRAGRLAGPGGARRRGRRPRRRCRRCLG